MPDCIRMCHEVTRISGNTFKLAIACMYVPSNAEKTSYQCWLILHNNIIIMILYNILYRLSVSTMPETICYCKLTK